MSKKIFMIAALFITAVLATVVFASPFWGTEQDRQSERDAAQAANSRLCAVEESAEKNTREVSENKNPHYHGPKTDWVIEVFKDYGDEKKSMCKETVSSDTAEIKEDGSKVYHTEHFTIIQPPSVMQETIIKAENAPACEGTITGEYKVHTSEHVRTITVPENKSVIYVTLTIEYREPVPGQK